MIKTICFDFDGVIKESVSVKTDAFAAMFQKYGEQVREQVVQFHLANGGLSRYHKISYYYSHFIGRPITQDELTEKANQFSELVKQKVIDSPYVVGAMEFLQEYAANYNCFVVTGTPQDEMLEIARECNLSKYFKGIYGSPQSKEEIISQILKQNDYSKSSIVMVGDAMTDYRAAVMHGIPFIGRAVNDNEFPLGTYAVSDLSNFKYHIDKLSSMQLSI